jgi:hypothetical protein
LGDAHQRVLSNFAAALPRLDGVFTPNQSTSLLTLGALRRLKAAGRVSHIGFDGDSVLIGAIRSGALAAWCCNSPIKWVIKECCRPHVYYGAKPLVRDKYICLRGTLIKRISCSYCPNSLSSTGRPCN